MEVGRSAGRTRLTRGGILIFRPYFYDSTGCIAYVFGCGSLGICAVVDPQAHDVEAYQRFAEAKGMRITHVFDTHVHADHRSGGRALAAARGASYHLHRAADVALPFEPVDDGQVFELGNTIVRVLHTPGHTPESICLLVTDLRRGPAPWFVLTGDTLFSGAVGRPDLPGHERENAAELHRSLHDKLLSLPDDIEVYPGHFAGSACGAGMSGKPSTTIGFEKRNNPVLVLDSERFVDALAISPPKPADMHAVISFNQGRD
jgi:glyoxylase-like metal-dependent hydrolase (beta-lactamase superfamily II)